jgi:hypothetical protein
MAAETETVWYGIGAEFDLPKHVFVAVTADRYDGDFEQSDQIYTSVSYRF